MWFAILSLILSSVYVCSCPNLKDESKTGYFVVFGLIVLAYIIFGVIL